MEIRDLVDKVIARKNKTITDEVFCLIQEDRDFMREYLQLVTEKGYKTVNRHIGKLVKEMYQLTDDGRSSEPPKSTLILSYQEFD